MKIINLLFTFYALLIIQHTFSQGVIYEKDIPGRLIKAPACKIPGSKIDALFGIINRLQVIKQPIGYDVQQMYSSSAKGKVNTAHLVLRLPPYYRINNGPLKLETAHPPVIGLFINDSKKLMNPQSILFPQETMDLKLPVMFTDTFSLTYENMNGQNVGYGLNTEYNSLHRVYVLNPRHTRLFKPVTKEQYILFWIGKLGLDIQKDSKQLEESKLSMGEIAGNPTLKASMPEIEKNMNAFVKWLNYLKDRKQYFIKKLAGLSTEEKKEPAFYAMYADGPALIDKNGKHVENISGHLPYEPAEDTDTLYRTPLYTYVIDPFNSTIPITAFQLIVIQDPFSENVKNRLKTILDEKFYPLLSFKEIADLMYK